VSRPSKANPEARAYFEKHFNLRGGKAQRTVCCPFHKDRKKSLSINLDTGLWNCHAGCGHGNLAKFRALLNDDAKPSEPDQIEKPILYTYTGAAGNPLFTKVRRPGKRFQWQRLVNGKLVVGLAENGPRPLYHLPEVLTAKYVAFCEGEKDADRLRAVLQSHRMKDWAATTNPNGAAEPFRDEWREALSAKRVIILPDNDEPGRRHADDYAAALGSIAASVDVLPLPDLPDGGDVSDYLAGHDEKALVALLKNPPEDPHLARFLKSADFAARTPENVPWLVENLVVEGACTELRGGIKIGKSTFVHEMLAKLLVGEDFLDRQTARTPVVYLSEMSEPDLRAQLKMSGLLGSEDLYLLTFQAALDWSWEDTVRRALAKCRKTQARLLVVDTFTVWSRNEDENSSSKTNEAFRPLQAVLASKIAVLLETHARKSGGGIDVSGRGSNALGGQASIIMELLAGGKGSLANDRKLSVMGRYSVFEEILRFAPPRGYTVLGGTKAVAKETAHRQFLDALPRSEEDAMTLKHLAEKLTRARTSLQTALTKGVKSNLIRRVLVAPGKKESKKNPFRYWCEAPKEPKRKF
jgi:hypothetical protein